jgi:hypothetical protein
MSWRQVHTTEEREVEQKDGCKVGCTIILAPVARRGWTKFLFPLLLIIGYYIQGHRYSFSFFLSQLYNEPAAASRDFWDTPPHLRLRNAALPPRLHLIMDTTFNSRY